jgi:starvation-inducible outer membrane lipoprotein
MDATLLGIPPGIRKPPPEDLQLVQVSSLDTHRGTRVRWGGTIVSLANQSGWTRVEVQAYKLGPNGQPDLHSPSANRFLVRANIPYDPQVYEKDRQITVAGTLEGNTEIKNAGRRSVLPLVRADELYLWGQSTRPGDDDLDAFYARCHYPHACYYRCCPYRLRRSEYYPWLPWYFPRYSLGLGYSKGYGWDTYHYLYWPGIGFHFGYYH